ncbi:MAG: septum formation inhibitor Maf [Deltaproteobacteria bacterium]|nr:septum formation inhibitor Maf [Deltaproteobacteria bacterium]
MSYDHDKSQLILASASPRRRELLQQAGVTFTVIPSNAAEDVLPSEAPAAYALRVAEAKAREVATTHPGSVVLGADTIVVINQTILGKPRDHNDGHRMLRLLSGQVHAVMTAFVVIRSDGQAATRQVVTTTVTFKSLSDEQIQAYLATGEPFDKAGAYAVQGLGAALVEKVDGSYTNVVGLPLDEVLEALRSLQLYHK